MKNRYFSSSRALIGRELKDVPVCNLCFLLPIMTFCYCSNEQTLSLGHSVVIDAIVESRKGVEDEQ